MTRLALPICAALLLAACSDRGTQAPDAEQASASAAVPATGAMPAAASSEAVASAATVSRYTSLESCKVTESGNGEDWSVSRCEGTGGYGLVLNYGDARDDLQLVRPGKEPADIGLASLSGGGFNALGETVEWRGTSEGTRFTPTSLIVRNKVSEDPDDSARQTAILTVIDLERSCVVAQVRPQAGQNEKARAIADGPRQACLGKE